jgi:MoxR-like ATPase
MSSVDRQSNQGLEGATVNRSDFRLYDPDVAATGQTDAARAERLASRRIPATFGNHSEAAPRFESGELLAASVNVALAVGAPLLEPGTGKTQVAHHLAWYFGVPIFVLDVRSTTTGNDLLYRFDHVAYFHASQDPDKARDQIDPADFVRPGPLWSAMKSAQSAVVLIDEIDKAPRDFPNDLLGVLDQGRFEVLETGEQVGRRPGVAPPVVVITSNSERRLPEPFLRRCIFHHIAFDETLLRRAVEARRESFPDLSATTIDVAIRRLLEIREKNLRKPPATAELLVWLAILSAQGFADHDHLREVPLPQLPALAALIKDREDLDLLA